MSVRRNTTNRLTLFRTCYTCGQTMITTADTPFVRQIRNVDGKGAKTCYFCSERCKQEAYIHKFDGLAWKRKEERDAARDITAKNKRFYAAHADELRARRRAQYYAMSEEDRAAENAYRRAKHAANREADNQKQREYRARKRAEKENT